jgi:hypothetical protein
MKRVKTDEERERSVYDVMCEWLACLEVMRSGQYDRAGGYTVPN